MAPLTNALAAGDGGPQVLVALDVQGLRQMQDQDHQRAGGPADLGRAVATGLAGVADAGGRCFRLAGGDFAILAPAAQEPRLRLALARLEAELLAVDPKGAGLAYGVVRWTPPAPEPLQLLQQAATRMYAHKALRRGQAGGAPATNET
jgi:predicted signal transduction protein with EAL and GGDEF domain